MIVAGDNISIEPGEIVTVTLQATVNSGTEGATAINTVNIEAISFAGVSDTVSNNVIAPVDPCTDGTTAGMITANDPDADGINNVCDLDNDNDGINHPPP